MTVLAILGYFCYIDFSGTSANYGTVLQLTLYHMYIQGECKFDRNFCVVANPILISINNFLLKTGDCTPSGFPQIEFTAIESLDLLTPSTLNIWMYVVLSLSVVWLLSSCTLIISKLAHDAFHNILITFYY
jgi:hypothetical protein